jgi:hypothetical protein
MKAAINIRDFLRDYAAYGTLSAEARIAIEDLLQCLDPSAEHGFDIDIYELLAHNREIAAIWCVDDVQELRPDLSEDQAWEVLQLADRRWDSEFGITWTTIEIIAQELFGDAPETAHAEEKQP